MGETAQNKHIKTAKALQIQTLGRFYVLSGDAPLPEQSWGTHKARSLFKILLTHYGKPVLRDQIMEALWPDASFKAGQRDLYTAVSDLRRALEPELDKASNSVYVLSTEEGYQFNLSSPHTLDKELFIQALERASALALQGKLEEAGQVYAQAEAIYAGDYLPDDLYADWSLSERERLRTRLLTGLLEAAEVQAQLGRYRQAMTRCRRALDMDNCLEEAYRALMLYQYAAGDRAQSLRVYDECQNVLQRELGVRPMPATIALAEQIRQGRVAGVDHTASYPPPSPRPLPYSLGGLPFVGREKELTFLHESLKHGREGGGSLVLVEGEAGMGKTSLVKQAIELEGLSAPLRGQCHELTQTLPYHPLVEILRQASRHAGIKSACLISATIDKLTSSPHPGSLAGKSEEKSTLFSHLRDCLVQMECQEGVLSLVIDDLQWADDGTLEFLAFIAPHLVESHVVILATCRPEERLKPLLSRAGRELWLQALRLAPLTEAELVELLERLAPMQPLVDALGQRLHRVAGGNPLFAASTLARLFETGQLWSDAEGRWQGLSELLTAPVLPVPREVEDLVEARSHSLSPGARRMIALASIIEEGFSLEFINRAYQMAYKENSFSPDELLDILDELTESDLLYSREDGSFRFRHDAMREAVYARIHLPRRQGLHRVVGELLEQSNPEPSRLAYHFGRSDDPERATAYLLAAATNARHLRAHRTALTLYSQALACVDAAERLHPDRPDYLIKDRTQAETGRVTMAYMLGLIEVGRASVTGLEKIAARVQGVDLVDSLTPAAYYLIEMCEYKQVLALTEPLLGLINVTDHTRMWTNLVRVRGYAYWELGRLAEMTQAFQQVLDIAVKTGNQQRQAIGWMYLGHAYCLAGKWNLALPAFEKADALAQAVNDTYLLANLFDARNELWEGLGKFDLALQGVEASQKLYHEVEVESVQPGLHLSLGRLYYYLGEPPRALEHLKLACEQFRALNQRMYEAVALSSIAEIEAQQQAFESSSRHYSQAAEILSEYDSQVNLTRVCALAAIQLIAHNRRNEAGEVLSRAAEAQPNRYTPLYIAARGLWLASQGLEAESMTELETARSLLMEQADCLAGTPFRQSLLDHPYARLVLDAGSS